MHGAFEDVLLSIVEGCAKGGLCSDVGLSEMSVRVALLFVDFDSPIVLRLA